jgi:hypothetical protein
MVCISVKSEILAGCASRRLGKFCWSTILSGTERLLFPVPGKAVSGQREFRLATAGQYKPHDHESLLGQTISGADYGILGEIPLDMLRRSRETTDRGPAIAPSRLKAPAPSIDRATAWAVMVKQGPIVREVRGLERLVSETIDSRGGVRFPSNRREEGSTECCVTSDCLGCRWWPPAGRRGVRALA